MNQDQLHLRMSLNCYQHHGVGHLQEGHRVLLLPKNPTIAYNTAGVYPVTLVASNGLGTGTTETITGYINVYATPTGICSSFSRSSSPVAGIGLTNVTLNTINNTTVYDGAVFNDYSCSEITELTASTLYNISTTVGGSNNQWLRVYIDYNGNDNFEAGELVFSPSNGTGVSLRNIYDGCISSDWNFAQNESDN